MRAIWKGAVAFGLVNVPVRLYAATGEHEVQLHQVHRPDGGRIRYRRTCSACGETVETADIAKGYETGTGELVVLTDEDLAELPLASGHEIEVLEFVPSDQVDPILLQRTYYLEPDKTSAKPYALLRGALEATDRMAVVKVALRQRESMAVLRVRGKVIVLQTLLWPDELRAADFPVLDAQVQLRPQELTMASSLVESLAADFDPSQYTDSYEAAMVALIEQKVSAGHTQAVPAAEGGEPGEGGEVVDLLAALQRSVEKARAGHGAPAVVEKAAPAARATRARKPAAPRTPTGSDALTDAVPEAAPAAKAARRSRRQAS
ncbi:non-homologous end joining protein Ku [Cellulomonas soli]|uniref:Non-homologous end joining protein Ku n=1 Tax=Cellulomonas soli TaxID=931535 RepID=A0A512PAF7_9CELL|nr:Ku protein [Cellulomonas soli]NYI60679.1 DNA end-binding protein Ku [Cellulomonas soli]GEP68194.1 non-homologous end joining protein Ku [Cellulomonas soli]